jgi:glucuronate isomerase
MDEDFLLDSARAKELFHAHAESLPIIDYHGHLSPRLIAENHQFSNLTEIWLGGDHYKWRAMRSCGVNERFITGDASDWEKFEKWAETVPKTLRNPLYHWTHLELRRPFGIMDRLLSPATARGIWDECKALLATPEFSVRGILKTMKVEVVCTTDDPVDDLEYHKIIAAANGNATFVYPAFRPDKVLGVEDPGSYLPYVEKLSEAANVNIRNFDDLLTALLRRHDFFHNMGCRLSDHGLETLYAEEYTGQEVGSTFGKVLEGRQPTPGDALKVKSALLYELAVMDWKKGWVQQFHLGALRNSNTRMRKTLGPDTGYDSIGDFEIGLPLQRLLDRLDAGNMLAKTIIYNLNPRDNELVASMTGNFQDGNVPGKIQFGAAWWFLDQLDGMTRQIDALSHMGLLSQFVGMLTDSRSFLSFPRHEYFRRLLCNILGSEMMSGRIPDDVALVGPMVEDICCYNARRYFGFPGLHPSGKPKDFADVHKRESR